VSRDAEISASINVRHTPPWLEVALRRWSTGSAGRPRGHAFLLISEDHMEAALLGELLSETQLCQAPQEVASCGECHSCRAIAQGAHGDLLVVSRPEGKNAIGIDQIRRAAQFLQQTAMYRSLKILLIKDADAMTLAAANSLLKTLEEPAGNALILLTTAEVWRLPPTIRSRCQRFPLPSCSPEQAVTWLISELDCNQSEAERLVEMTQCQPVSAWAMQQAGEVSARDSLWRSFEQLGAGAPGVPADWSGVSAGQLVSESLVWVEHHTRESMMSRDRQQGERWLVLHRCLTEVAARLKQGATPAHDILTAELNRLFRSRSHDAFPEVATRFLEGLGRLGVAG